MTHESDTNTQFERLSAEIARDEQALRDSFAATPTLAPAALQRIRDRLHAEVVAIHSPRTHGSAWLRCLAATAATLLLALGVRFYAMTSHDIADRDGPAQASDSTSLGTGFASLPGTLADEYQELDELRSELWQLEMQAATDTTDPGEAGDPAAERDWSDSTRSRPA